MGLTTETFGWLRDGIGNKKAAQEIEKTLTLNAYETPTIASGVLTATQTLVDPQPESSTTDTVDSIVYADASEGSILILQVKATNTITVDDASINLGAATRAIAPGGSLILVYDGTQWTELTFLAASDNS
jgi:hypothetical protein